MKLTQVTHYSEDDTKFWGDYYSVELLKDDKVIASYGDHYHEKGEERLQGFIAGIEWATGEKVELTHKKIADGRI